MKRVYLVDDSELVRRRLVAMLAEIEDVEIIGQTVLRGGNREGRVDETTQLRKIASCHGTGMVCGRVRLSHLPKAQGGGPAESHLCQGVQRPRGIRGLHRHLGWDNHWHYYSGQG